MIIKREYVTFRALINTDPDAKALITRAFEESYPEDIRESAFIDLLDRCLYQRAMEWAMQGIGDLIDSFEKLDKEKPYDNGFTYADVNDVDIILADEHTLILHLVNVLRDDGDIYRNIVERIEKEI